MSPTFTPDYDERNIEPARKWLGKTRDSSPYVRKDACSWWCVTGNGKVLQDYPGNACHMLFGYYKGLPPDIIANYVHLTTDDERLFMNWLATESFFAPYCLNRDTAVEDCGLMLPCDLPSRFLHLANLLCRFVNEHADRVPSFARYYKMGFEGVIAYCFATMISVGSTAYHNHAGHGYAWPNATKKLFDNLVASNLVGLEADEKTYKNGSRDYYGVSSIGYPSNHPIEPMFLRWFMTKDEDFKQRLAEMRGNTEVVSPISNPFAVTSPSSDKTSNLARKEYEELLLPYLIEKGIYTRNA